MEKLSNIQFPDYKNTFEDINTAYSDFFDKLDKVLYEIAPIKEICIKNTRDDWFDFTLIT